jgi:ABC-type branched-subunit amino acid transport system substrate-binding protein
MHISSSRRDVLIALSRGLTFLGSAAVVGGCAISGPNIEATSALPAAAAPAETATANVVKVALLLPSGAGPQVALVAKAMQQAAELALFDRTVTALQLVVRDDKGTPEGAAEAARSALKEGCELILGPLLSSSVAAVAPIAREAGVPVVAFSNDPAVGGNGVYLLSFFAAGEAARLAEFASAKGKRNFAALLPSDSLGRDSEPAFRKAIEAAGGAVAAVEWYPPDLSGMMEPAQRVVDAIRSAEASSGPIDALFLPSSSDNLGRISAMLRHLSLDTGRVQLLLSSGWDTPQAIADERLKGAWLAQPEPAGWRDFGSRFAKAYTAMPPRIASLAYDAVTVAAAFATQPAGQRFTAANLQRPNGFTGADGPFRLTARGPVERNLAVLEIREQTLITVDAARHIGPAQPGLAGTTEAVRG